MSSNLSSRYATASYVSSDSDEYSAWNNAPIEGRRLCADTKLMENPVYTGKLVGNWELTHSTPLGLCARGAELRNSWRNRTGNERTETFERIRTQVSHKRRGTGSGYIGRPRGQIRTNMKTVIANAP